MGCSTLEIPHGTTFENGYGAYVQDSYRLNSRVTVNYGVRGTIRSGQGEEQPIRQFPGEQFRSDADVGSGTLTQVGSPGLSRLYEPDYKNFSPRASIAGTSPGGVRRDSRRIRIVLRCILAGYFPGPSAVSGFLRAGSGYGQLRTGPNYGCLGLQVKRLLLGSRCTPTRDVRRNATFSQSTAISRPVHGEFNLNFQQQIADKIVLQLGYVGSQGHRLFRFYDINQPTQAAITAGDLAGGILDFGVPRPLGMEEQERFIFFRRSRPAKSNYNSLQSSLRLSGWHGITSAVNYVWSKSLDNSSDGEDFVVNAAQPQDSNNHS